MSRVLGQIDASTNDTEESIAPGVEVPPTFWKNLNDLVHKGKTGPRHC